MNLYIRNKLLSPNYYSFYRDIVLTVIALSGLLSLIVLIIYCINFIGPLSGDSSHWNDFGAYIGGTIGTLLSFVNFLILSYLTIKFYYKKNQQWLTDLRSPFYKDISTELFKIRSSPLNDTQELNGYIKWLQFSDFKRQLFLNEENQITILSNHKNNLIQLLTARQNMLTSRDINIPEANENIYRELENFMDYLFKIMCSKTN